MQVKTETVSAKERWLFILLYEK